jgi:hypothetical protein
MGLVFPCGVSNDRFNKGNAGGKITAQARRIFAIMATAVQDGGPFSGHHREARDRTIAGGAAAGAFAQVNRGGSQCPGFTPGFWPSYGSSSKTAL